MLPLKIIVRQIKYKNLKPEILGGSEDLFIFDNGFRLVVEFKENKIIVKLNDELLDKPFSDNDIKLIEKNFRIKNPIIKNTWSDQEEVLFHDNLLSLEFFGKDSLYSFIKFIFEKIYKIDE